jgi:signal transduction histidine kinase
MPEAAPALVLIVDDNEGVLRLIEKALQREGCSTATAGSGKEAITWLLGHRADLMLLDLKLPDIEGKALVDHLADIRRTIPFIVITGQGDERVAVDMMKRGALDYLVKDVGFLQFVPEVVRRGLARLGEQRRLAAAEQQLAAAHAALRQSHEEVLATSEREQRRIGHDLHDGLGQHLTALEMKCFLLLEDVSSKDFAARQKQLKQQAERISRDLRECIALTRSLARGLAPVTPTPDGLMEGLKELATRATAPGQVECRFECAGLVLLEDSQTTGHLYRIAQEALNNALKHADARRITVKLSRASGALRLQVKDDGRGLPKAQKCNSGMGLEIMRHRAHVIGASLEVDSRPGGGVTITCTLPMNEDEG